MALHNPVGGTLMNIKKMKRTRKLRSFWAGSPFVWESFPQSICHLPSESALTSFKLEASN